MATGRLPEIRESNRRDGCAERREVPEPRHHRGDTREAGRGISEGRISHGSCVRDSKCYRFAFCGVVPVALGGTLSSEGTFDQDAWRFRDRFGSRGIKLRVDNGPARQPTASSRLPSTHCPSIRGRPRRTGGRAVRSCLGAHRATRDFCDLDVLPRHELKDPTLSNAEYGRVAGRRLIRQATESIRRLGDYLGDGVY